MCLPMGELTKTRVREIAAARGFLKAAKKRDSLGVCFCPMDYRTFLKAHVPEGEIIPGSFYNEQGQKIGKHEGYPFYTIGQRRGLGIHLNKALFVKEIIPQENKVIISDNLQALEKNEMYLTHWNLINPDVVLGHEDVIVKYATGNKPTDALLPYWTTSDCIYNCMSRWLLLPADRQLHFIGVIPYWEEGLLSNQQSFSLHFSKK